MKMEQLILSQGIKENSTEKLIMELVLQDGGILQVKEVR